MALIELEPSGQYETVGVPRNESQSFNCLLDDTLDRLFEDFNVDLNLEFNSIPRSVTGKPFCSFKLERTPITNF